MKHPAGGPSPGGGGLRRADWRFLLPGPRDGHYQHLVLLGGPAGLAERLGEAGLAARVSGTVPSQRTADLLVVMQDARVDIAVAARCLVPGGAFYVEVDRTRPRHLTWTPARVDRVLRRLGLTPMTMYWVLPSFDRTRCFCPLFHPGAVRWCLRALFPAPTLRRRLLRSGAEILLGGRSGRLSLPGVSYAIAGLAGTDGDGRPTALRSDGLPALVTEPGLSYLAFTHGSDDFGRVVLLPFAAEGRSPLAVLKVARFPARNPRTVHEQAVLGEVRQQFDGPLRDVLPRPLGIARWGDLTVGVESCVPGQLLSTMPSRRGGRSTSDEHLHHLELVTAWLIELHTRARVGWASLDAAKLHEWVEAPCAEYERCLGPSEPERQLLAAVRERAVLLRASSIPLVWEHYDLGPWNIYRSEHGIHVVDWESSTPKLPLSDLLYFATHWSLGARGIRTDRGRLEDFERLFGAESPGDWLVSAVHRSIARYLTQVGVDPRLYPLLLARLWVVHAVGWLGRERILGAERKEPRVANPYVRYVQVLARYRERLFEATLPSGVQP